MRWTIAALILAAGVTGAQAQMGQQTQINNAAKVGQSAAADAAKNNADTAKVKANEKAYNAALHNLPDRQYDPWHGVR
jgi:hypothetical protein